ncbi:four-carbon acid sugar kinase family protein [Pseudonocardia charpentierae]|uniref:Four-carbon acid sugar kinase family protein n=1 Tax=Pseudonocardia charpentierae TaxID=3075545 RepID=A0ABU2N3N2_9PSEU|nr:four-carbon acid sugar kinase family protein [Pseudonocardia sp. DSM 45834]MDT0348528.1 four-carbon acid sugar kinase family protein [Pseudonocardia sp. DSM 45834]
MTNPGVDLAALPPLRVVPDARWRIREALAGAGRRIAVFDDDPTGSQTVHDVAVVTVFDPEEIAAGLDGPGSTCFILTNTRSMDETDAVALNTRVGRTVFELGRRLDAPIDVISRSDSTLRGHVIAEVSALDAVRREVLGRGFDGVLLIPAFLEAGRFTAGDVHWARVDGEPTPVGETEFARDATFGFTASDLREFVAEKSRGTIAPGQVHSLTLDDIRRGGSQRVAEILAGVTDGAFVVVNAVDYADLDVVVLGLLEPQVAGKAFLYRTGPSFPQALAGLDPRPPLTASDIWPADRPGGHGLVVVGSHVGLTSRQVAVAQERGGIVEVELDVPAVADPTRRDAHVAEVTARVVDALAGSDVLLFTSRTLLRDTDPAASLDIARQVSTAVITVVRGAVAGSASGSGPAWVVAKGGITSHDVAVRGLGIRRATVLGQLLPGLVSVFQPVEALPEVVGVPYVVFAGNVGDENTLAYVIDLFSGRTAQ